MVYLHSIEKANEFASDAIERMHAERLAPTPENYELWYVYYAKTNPEVVHAIDMLIEEGHEITNERCQDLHQRYLSETKETVKVREAGNKIQATIREVNSAVTSVKDATAKYGNTLHGMSTKLSGDVTAEEVKGVVSTVLADTHDMIKHNAQLEQELEKSSTAMQDLQKELELARKEALTDGLTRLANRKAFDGEIQRIAQRCKEEGTTFCLIMMDIDHFKNFNDDYGHQVGDQVLKLVAKVLTDGVKGKDMAARYGGEEFAIILPDTNIRGGERVGDMLREAVARKDVINKNSGEKLGRITLSAGVAEYILDEPIENLIGRADAALYIAKRGGRNRISVAPTPGSQQETG